MVLLGRFPRVEGEEVRLALLASGLEVEVRGEARAPLEGMLPSGDVGLELWVDEAVLARAQALQREVEAEHAAPTPRAPQSGSGRPSAFTALFALTTVILAGLLWQERRQPKARDSGEITWREVPGFPCVSGLYKNRTFQRSCDRNGDGNWEQVEQFDRQGKLISSSYDADEDGIPDQIVTYDVAGRAVSRSQDLDHDWRTDRVETFDLEDRVLLRTFDDDHDGRDDRALHLDSAGNIGIVTTFHGDDWDAVYLLDGGTVTERVRGDRHELVIGDGGVPLVLTADGWR